MKRGFIWSCLRGWGIALGAVFAFVTLSFARVADMDAIDAGELKRKDEAEKYPLFIDAQDAYVLNLARRAFDTHGAFELAASAKGAPYTLRLMPTNPESGKDKKAAAVRFVLKTPTQELESLSEAATLRKAVLAACDYVVLHCTQKEGFFNRELAFLSDQSGHTELYLSPDLFAQEGVLRLTQDKSDLVRPSWTAQGQLLYSSTAHSGQLDVFLHDPKRAKRDCICSKKGDSFGARMNPKSDQIILSMTPIAPNGALGLSTLYSTRLQPERTKMSYKKLTRSKPSNGNLPKTKRMKRESVPKSIETGPSFSPDGTQVCISKETDSRRKPMLFIVPSQGGYPKPIRTDISGHCTEPAWNPFNAHLIAFTAACNRGFDIALYDHESKETRFITGSGNQTSACEPFWLDHRHLAYTSRTRNAKRKNAYQLRVVDIVSGKDRALSDPKARNVHQAALRLH